MHTCAVKKNIYVCFCDFEIFSTPSCTMAKNVWAVPGFSTQDRVTCFTTLNPRQRKPQLVDKYRWVMHLAVRTSTNNKYSHIFSFLITYIVVSYAMCRFNVRIPTYSLPYWIF